MNSSFQDAKARAQKKSSEKAAKYIAEINRTKEDVINKMHVLTKHTSQDTLSNITGIPVDELSTKFTFEEMFPSLQIEDTLKVNATQLNEELEKFNRILDAYNARAAKENTKRLEYYENYYKEED